MREWRKRRCLRYFHCSTTGGASVLSPPETTPPQPAQQPGRRDARRNRDKLIATAQAAFAAAEGPVALEAIARQAGVGIGTLYRHFPTREDLVDAVYAAELEAVTTSVSALLGRH